MPLGLGHSTFELDFAKISYDGVCSMLDQLRRAGCGSDPYDQPEIAGAGRFDPRYGILEDCHTWRHRVETACSFQEHVGSWLSRKTQSIQVDAIDSCIEERCETGCVQ